MDFTTDDHFLMFKDNFEDIVTIDIEEQKKTTNQFIEFDVVWVSDGIKTSEKAKGVQDSYDDSNRVMKMCVVGENGKTLVVTDEVNYFCVKKDGNCEALQLPLRAGRGLQ